jgi:hypothetical protein
MTFGTTAFGQFHRYVLIRPDEPPATIVLATSDEQRALLGGSLDHGSLSRHFHYIVYEFSITEHWPVNALMRRGDRDVPIYGPCLIYKTDDAGSTIDIDDADLLAITALWAEARAGRNPDSLTLG